MKLNVDIFMQIARNEKRYSRSTKKILALHLIAALFLITPLCSIGQKSEQFVVDNRSIDINHLNSEIESVMDTVIVPGMSLAVIDQGEVVFSGAYGVRGNDEEVTEGTTFQAASLSKVFLMYAALKMADEGLLDLNKPVYQYLPNPRLSHDERYLKITSRMLLFHTSGIEDWENENNPQILEIISDPDERFVYSGEGYNYLADAIAEILNKPIVQYMKELVYEPLGLKHTYSAFEQGGTIPANYALGHSRFGNLIKNQSKNLEPIPSSAIQTTANDYAKMIIAMFDKNRIPTTLTDDFIKPVFNQDNGENFYMGHGFQVEVSDGDTLLLFWGSNPGYRAQMFYSVKKSSGLVLFTNGNRGELVGKYLSKKILCVDVNRFFDQGMFEQYPSNACTLFKNYQDDKTKLRESLERLIDDTQGNIGMNTLSELAYILKNRHPAFVEEILEKNLELYPNSAQTYWVKGKMKLREGEFQEALKSLHKAKEMGYDDNFLEFDIQICQDNLAESNR